MDPISYVKHRIQEFADRQKTMLETFERGLLCQIQTKTNDEKTTSLIERDLNCKPVKANNYRLREKFCGFCRKNGEMTMVFSNHTTKDENGLVICPILQKYICEYCGATGVKAHTKKYCPWNVEEQKSTERSKPPYRLLANGRMCFDHNHK